MARTLAESSEAKPELKTIPPSLRAMSYDDYRNLRFRQDKALWLQDKLPFRVEFFHLGRHFAEPVTINEFTDNHMQEIPFMKDFFDYRQTSLDPRRFQELPGYAGFRVKYPLNTPQVYDDLIVFQGASYFRALSRGSAYGMSARGLGVNIDKGKEAFPRFTQFWLEKPDSGSRQLKLYALLESEAVTGAYEFTIQPGVTTRIGVRLRVWPRTADASLCFAPLTSMFYFGENTEEPVREWRPEIHDSDGLLIQGDGNWFWMPLRNPGQATPASQKIEKLKGFGLLQRDRRFSSYRDLEARYDLRPSAWISPVGDWPAGEVVLYQFYTPDETNDNVNAFWRPDTPPVVGQPFDLSYTLSWLLQEPDGEMATVLESFIGEDSLQLGNTVFVIEFSPPKDFNPSTLAMFTPEFTAGGAEIVQEPILQHNHVDNALRVFFTLRPAPGNEPRASYPLSLQLLKDGKPASEKWIYSWEK
ncbi:MAG: glucan biosynthesis protein [Puniceicoccales bacterium]